MGPKVAEQKKPVGVKSTPRISLQLGRIHPSNKNPMIPLWDVACAYLYTPESMDWGCNDPGSFVSAILQMFLFW